MRISDWSSDVCSSDLFAWVLKCSVRLTMRSVRIATWTSGLPVSPSARALSEMISDLRSAVTDIVHSLKSQRLKPRTTRTPCPETSTSRSEEHTSELQSLMRISYAVFCLKKKKHKNHKY